MGCKTFRGRSECIAPDMVVWTQSPQRHVGLEARQTWEQSKHTQAQAWARHPFALLGNWTHQAFSYHGYKN